MGRWARDHLLTPRITAESMLGAEEVETRVRYQGQKGHCGLPCVGQAARGARARPATAPLNRTSQTPGAGTFWRTSPSASGTTWPLASGLRSPGHFSGLGPILEIILIVRWA